MSKSETTKTLSQLIADEANRPPVAPVPEAQDAELQKVRENHPHALRVYRDERGSILVNHGKKPE